ncbi:MAG TPA: type II secretion system F family protein, partial [Clostridia bacterium]|nr:type II secretion system F family protein [Clostridia bacterium]
MSNYSYIAVDPRGMEMRGTLEVADQNEAMRRIREMGLFPTKIAASSRKQARLPASQRQKMKSLTAPISIPLLRGRIKTAQLAVFTRQ